MAYLKALATRFKEPSSWAGLAAFLAIVGVNLEPGLFESISYIGAGVAGVLAVVIKE